MYLWKTHDLALKIKEEQLNGNVKKNYFLAFSILGLITFYIGVLSGTLDSTVTLIEALLLIIITVIYKQGVCSKPRKSRA